MTAKIIPFTGVTSLDHEPDQIFDACKGRFEGVVVLGWDTDGQMVFSSSYADGGTVLWLLEQCKAALLGSD